MRVLYFLLLAVACAACADTDSPRTESAAAGSPRQVPPALATPGVPVAASPAAQPTKPGIVRQPRRVVGQRPRPPKTLEPTDWPVQNIIDYAAPDDAPDSLSFGAAKAAQRFWVSPGRDTVLYGAEGTTIWVPAQAFAVGRADAPAVAGLVEVCLKEFYTLPDILLNNLSTASSQGLLETGGMLHLEARTASGQTCVLRKSTELLLRVPASHPKPAMQLYTGVRTAAHGLDWQRPIKALNPQLFWGFGPEAVNEPALVKQLCRRIGYTVARAQQLQEQPRSRQRRKELRRQARYTGRRFLEYGRLAVRSDQQGRVTDAQVIGIQDSVLAERIREAAWQLPAFQPAYLQADGPAREAKAQRSYLMVKKKRQTAAKTPKRARMPVAGYWLLDIAFTSKGRVWVPWPGMSGADFAPMPLFDPQAARSQLQQANTTGLQATNLDSLGGYLFSAANLGWTNCDRPTQFAGPRVRFGVEADAPQTRIHLVFRRVRAVVPSDGEQPNSRQQLFHAAPANEPATIVALKREAGVTYLATKEIILSEGIEQGLVFRPVTPAELRTVLAGIEQ